MRITDQLVELGEVWTRATGLSLGRLGTIVVNRGHFFDGLQRGGDCGTDTFIKFLHFFRSGDNWPGGQVPADAAALLDNFENIAVATDAATGKIDNLPPAGVAA